MFVQGEIEKIRKIAKTKGFDIATIVIPYALHTNYMFILHGNGVTLQLNFSNTIKFLKYYGGR